MDSRELFKAASHLTTVLIWEDWIHCGTENNINTNLITELLDNFLIDEIVNFVHKRTNSGACTKLEILPRIKELLGTENFQLWNESLTRSIQFSNIGVLRKGEKTSNNNH